jgi:hypothetical protein
VNGKIGDLTGYVPKSYIHGADGVGRNLPIRLPKLMPNGPYIQRIRAHDGRLAEFHERSDERISALPRGAKKSMAFDPGVGMHRHNSQKPLAAEGCGGRFPQRAFPIE